MTTRKRQGKRGWENDIEIEGGKILLEFEAQLITSASQQIVCDSELWSCLEVKHGLVIELFVAEGFVNNTTKVVARTGASQQAHDALCAPSHE